MNKEEETIRGNEAALVINNPLYREAVMMMRGKMMDDFSKTTFDQSKERDEIWRKMLCLDGLEAQLNAIMTTGRMVTAEAPTTGAPH